MRNIKFYFDNNKNSTSEIYNEIEVKFDTENLSIFSVKGGGNCCLVSESGIEIFFDKDTKKISGLGGYIGEIQNFGQVSTTFNNQEGFLCVENNEDIVPVVAYTFKFSNDVIYDKVNNILLFGNYNKNLPVLKFLKNAYAQLDESGSLSSILISNINLQLGKEKERQ